MTDKTHLFGFLLSRQWRDTSSGINLSFWLSSSQGPVHIIIDKRDHLAYDKSQLLESEIKPTERYLMERFITASLSVDGTPIKHEGYLEYRNPILKPAAYNPDLNCVSLDIETENFRGKLYSIAVVMGELEQVFMVKKEPSNNANKNIDWCDSEKTALEHFFTWMRQHDPDVIIGWNVIAFVCDRSR